MLRRETLIVIGVWIGTGLVAGAVAAFGGKFLRTVVLAMAGAIWVDAAADLPALFDRLTPETRAVQARDRRRMHDIAAIREALESHIRKFGSLPMPAEYGEGTGTSTFWDGWWDVSTGDGNADGRYFLEFLVDRGLMASVPLDPQNQAPPDGHPTRGRQYVYFVAPAAYEYQGGACLEHAGSATYLLAVTNLETEPERPPVRHAGSGCECLWRDQPNFFQQHFDYVVCGWFKP